MPAADPGALSGRALLLLLLLHAMLLLLAFGAAPAGSLFILIQPVPAVIAALTARSLYRFVLIGIVVTTPVWLWLNGWMHEVTPVGHALQAPVLAGLGLLPAITLRVLLRGRRPACRWPVALLLPLSVAAWEGFRAGVLLDGYPWFLTAHALGPVPLLIQSADLLGACFVSSLVVVPAGAIVDLVRLRSGGAPPATARAGVAAAGVALLFVLLYGAMRGGDRAPAEAVRLDVLSIQTNLPQSNKISATLDQQVEFAAGLIRQTADAVAEAVAAGTPPGLIVWPETMLPGLGLDRETMEFLERERQSIHLEFARVPGWLAGELETPLLVGSIASESLRIEEGYIRAGRRFNSVYLVDPRGAHARADKVALTPFGETIPWLGWWPAAQRAVIGIAARGMAFNLSAGDQPTVLAIPGVDGPAALGAPICFESTVPGVCRALVNAGAGLLVNVSNDGWFGSSDRARRHFVDICRFRCVENRVTMVRSANTGLTVAIDRGGNLAGVVGEGRYGEARRTGALSVPVEVGASMTLYRRVGEIWPLVSAAGLLVILAAGLRTGGSACG